MGDIGRILSSLISNLAHNAIKYIGEGAERRITIRVLDRDAILRFEVEDTGPGLPPGFEQVVFQPYIRARGSLQPGFGLGLATVKKAVEAHGGRVGVRSQVGRGCLFFFELPTRTPSPPPT
jgi:signal transduction histidine kinase